MNGSHVTDLLSDYMEGWLDTSRVEKVKTHLIFCNVCRSQLQELEANREKLKSLPRLSPAPNLEGKILAKVYEELNNKPAPSQPVDILRGKQFFTWRGWAMAVVSILVIIGLWDILPREQGKQIPDQVQSTSGTKQKWNAVQKPAPVQAPAILESDGGEYSRETLRKTVPYKEFGANIPKKGIAESEILRDQKLDTADKMEESKTHPNAIQTEPRSEGAVGGHALSQKVASEERSPVLSRSRQSGAAGFSSREALDLRSNPQLWGTAGPWSGIRRPYEVLITNSDDWKRLWAKHIDPMPVKSALPPIDFNKSDVIGVFAGRQDNRAEVKIISINHTVWNGAPARIIRYSILPAKSDDAVQEPLNSPYVLRELPKFQGPTFFQNNP